jgi:type I restriction enzyme, R subunit
MQHQRMVFIFDECHRSQFGDTHKNIVNYFQKVQLFGFTGTPILAENANGEKTTSSLFGKCLHKYVITDAIRDENVLRFSAEYIQTFKSKAEILDLKVEKINEKEVFESNERRKAIVDYIIQYHPAKTQNRNYCAMMCVQDIDAVINYYELFKLQKLAGKHDLKVVTIFSFVQNEEEMAFNSKTEGSVVEEPQALYGLTPHRRELLDEYIKDFNHLFGTAHSNKDTESFYNYYNDVSKMTKQKRVDILLVANMFLTGFDNKWVNTLYVDKNLQYHGLIQAFSRTNRTHNVNKTQGNIVCFRNLKDKTDEAITLFSNKEAIDEVIMKSYSEYEALFNDEVDALLRVVPSVESVDDLYTEEDKMQFILAFRAMMRTHQKMNHYTEFSWEHLQMDEQTFADYSSKYQDLKDSITIQSGKEKTSILNDIDFELELIRRDNIDVMYIIELLSKLKGQANKTDQATTEQQILNLLNSEVTLRSKRKLIEKFMNEQLGKIQDIATIQAEFERFWEQERNKRLQKIVAEEDLWADKTMKLIDDYLFSQQKPLRDEVLKLRKGAQPSILKRQQLSDKLIERIIDYVNTFVNHV